MYGVAGWLGRRTELMLVFWLGWIRGTEVVSPRKRGRGVRRTLV